MIYKHPLAVGLGSELTNPARTIHQLNFRGTARTELSLEEFLQQMPVKPGWHPLIQELCLKLWSLGWDGKVDQVKEKFGGLRFYVDSTDMHGVASDAAWSLIQQTEFQSLSVCELCGTSPAAINRTRYWLKTFCTECDLCDQQQNPQSYRGQ